MDATTTGVGCDYCCMLYEKLVCIFRVFTDILPQMNVHLGYNAEQQGVGVHGSPAEPSLLCENVAKGTLDG